MGIGTVDALLNGRLPALDWSKAGFTGEAAGLLHSSLYLTGMPGAGAAPSAGVNGAQVLNGRSGTLAAPAAVAGKSCYLNMVEMAQAGSIGAAFLVDRLWENSGLDVTISTLQAITPAAPPARDANNSALGVGVGLAIEIVTATANGGAVNATITYTDSDGNTGATGVISIPATAAVGTWLPLPLAAGDYGVRVPTGFQLASTLTSGALSLVLYRRLGRTLGIPLTNTTSGFGPADGGVPIADGTAPHFIYMLTGTSNGVTTGSVQFCQA